MFLVLFICFFCAVQQQDIGGDYFFPIDKTHHEIS